MQEAIYHVRTEFMLFLKTYKCNGDIITDNDTMNRHKSQCILIQSILYNNFFFFATHVKTIIFSHEAKFENFVRGFMARQNYFICLEQSRTLCQIGTSLARFPEP